MSETVRETIDRIMQQTGYYGQPLTVKTPVGDRTCYVNADLPLAKNKPNNLQQYNQAALNNSEKQYSMPHSNWNNVAMGAITGAGEGLIGGAENAINGLTQGGYGVMVDSIFDNAYSNRQIKLQQQADVVGLGNANRIANLAARGFSSTIPLVYGYGKFNIKY